MTNQPKRHEYKFTVNYKDGSSDEYTREMTDAEKHEHVCWTHERRTVRSVTVERIS